MRRPSSRLPTPLTRHPNWNTTAAMAQDSFATKGASLSATCHCGCDHDTHLTIMKVNHMPRHSEVKVTFCFNLVSASMMIILTEEVSDGSWRHRQHDTVLLITFQQLPLLPINSYECLEGSHPSTWEMFRELTCVESTKYVCMRVTCTSEVPFYFYLIPILSTHWQNVTQVCCLGLQI